MKNDTPKICCYGELLWDVYAPDQKRLGGAPYNVANRLHSYGAQTQLITAIGKDDLGQQALEIVKADGLSNTLIQENSKPTGTVDVHLDSSKKASYTINTNVAWDYIEATPTAIEAVTTADAFVYGSLALRQTHNQQSFETLIDKASYKVFDVNLREPHYDLTVVIALMEIADFIKLNDEELELITTLLDITKDTLEEEIRALATLTQSQTICVTLGADGAMLFHKGKIYTQKAFPIEVVDTVGAGDSFLATLLFGLLSKETPEDSLALGCCIGALVASKAGANPSLSQEEINEMMGW